MNSKIANKQIIQLRNNRCLIYTTNDKRQRYPNGCIIDDCRPVVIAIPDIGADSCYWQGLADHLNGIANVFAFDLPEGAKFDTIKAINPTQFADYLLQFLTILTIQKVYLIGHGYGAQVVLRFAKLHPSKVVKIVASSLNPAPYLMHQTDWPYFLDASFQKLLDTLVIEQTNETVYQTLIKRLDPIPCQAIEGLMSNSNRCNLSYRFYLPLLKMLDTRADLDLVSQPVLLMNGALDPFTPNGLTKSLVNRSTISLIQFANQGHNYPILDNQTFNSAVYSFFFIVCQPSAVYFKTLLNDGKESLLR